MWHGVNYSTYYAKHRLGDNDLYFMVNLDSSTNGFSIIPIEQTEYEQKIVEPAKSSGSKEDTVEKNEYNTIPYQYFEEEDIVDKYFQDYLENALFNPEIAYNSLDEEYRSKKFGSLENFEEYVDVNRETMEAMCKATRKDYTDFDTYQKYEEYYSQISKFGLERYNIDEENGKEEYICIDSSGRYYIFDISSIMNYTLILDTYTIDLPQFTEQYNNSTDAEKVLMNIQKVFSAINDGDYNYVYNKLDNTFKQNNFPTLESFETYMKSNFYENNSIGYSNYRTSGNLHIYDISITDADNEESTTVTKNFIMQLLDGTDFVMSFNV